MTLRDHIDNEYKGNVSAFSRSVGTSQTQAVRWLEMDCVYIDGQILKPIKDIKEPAILETVK